MPHPIKCNPKVAFRLPLAPRNAATPAAAAHLERALALDAAADAAALHDEVVEVKVDSHRLDFVDDELSAFDRCPRPVHLLAQPSFDVAVDVEDSRGAVPDLALRD